MICGLDPMARYPEMADSTRMSKAWRIINVAALAYATLQSVFLGWVVPAIWL